MLHHFPMARVYSYTRFSTPEQAAGDSYRRQMDAARAYASEHGLTLDDRLSIADLGVSAFTGGNLDAQAGLGRFVDAVKNGLVEPGSVLLLESLDRLTRMQPFDAQLLFSNLIAADLTIVTLGDGQRYDRDRLQREPWAFMTAYMVSIRAHEESATKGRRVKAAWAEKRRKVRAGESKRLTRKAPAWLKAEGEGWAVDESRAALVRRIYQMTLAGQGEHKVAETLNGEGVPPLGRGTMWHRSSVAKLLRNPAVVGTLVPGRMERANGRKVRVSEDAIPNAFPPIVPEDEWLAVRSLKDGHAPANRGRGANAPLANLLAGLARCPICGAAMTRVNKGARQMKPKLVCTRAKAGAAAHYHSVSLAEVQAAILERPAWLVDGIPAGERCAELDEAAEGLRGSIDGLTGHLADLDEETSGRPRSRAVAERFAKIGGELDTLQAKLDAVEERRRLVDGGLVQDRVARLAVALRDYDGGPLEPLNAAMRVLFEGVTVDYRSGTLVFRWRQGGESTLPYALGFGNEEARAV